MFIGAVYAGGLLADTRDQALLPGDHLPWRGVGSGAGCGCLDPRTSVLLALIQQPAVHVSGIGRRTWGCRRAEDAMACAGCRYGVWCGCTASVGALFPCLHCRPALSEEETEKRYSRWQMCVNKSLGQAGLHE